MVFWLFLFLQSVIDRGDISTYSLVSIYRLVVAIVVLSCILHFMLYVLYFFGTFCCLQITWCNLSYSVNGELKNHNLCSRYPSFSLKCVDVAFVSLSDGRITTFSWCHFILYQWWTLPGLWVKSCFHRMHNMTASKYQLVLAKMMSWVPGFVLAVSLLQI